MAREPRIPAAQEECLRARAAAAALAQRLPVTRAGGAPPSGGPPVDVQLAIRDEARALLRRQAVTPTDAERLLALLPSPWRRQFAPALIYARSGTRLGPAEGEGEGQAGLIPPAVGLPEPRVRRPA